MKKIVTLIALLLSTLLSGQTSLETLFEKADSAFFDYKNYPLALDLYKQIEKQISPSDKDWNYTINKIARSLFLLESDSRKDPKKSIDLSEQYIEFADKNKQYLDTVLYEKKYFMYKNIVVGYFALNQIDKAKIYQDKLYGFYKQKVLPKGIDEYYNFEFFQWDGKNVWGYEWFEDLPEDRFSRSFSKIVYYIYSTNPDGTDKDQLYRLHVLMFHKTDASTPFDYVLTKRLETATNEVSGTLYAYTYTKDIDFNKLRHDIREVLKGNYEPDTKSEVKKKN
ncbi:MAG: hypothetical protein JST26_13230 [Bacteroidetes bacterium]|nr:hypothetical protein [Bacteroidota bacterium]